MKKRIRLIKTWLLIGLRFCPATFLCAILARVVISIVYYFSMIFVSNLINAFGVNDVKSIKSSIFGLIVFTVLSVILLVIQDVNDTKLNIELKKIYTTEIISQNSHSSIISIQSQEYQNELVYAIQAMNGTDLFSPTLSIINMIFGSIANILIVIKALNHAQTVLIFLLLTFVFVFGLILGNQRNKRYFKKENMVIPLQREKENYSGMLCQNQFFQENYIYNFSNYIMKKWRNKFSDINSIQHKENKKISFEMLLSNILITLILGLTLIFLTKEGSVLSAGSIIIVIGSIISLLQGIQGISYFVSNFFQGVATLEKVDKLKEYDLTQIESYDKLHNNSETTNCINITNLCFSYPQNDSDIISNLNYRIKKGKVTAIVGENGCGKTTLIKLIAGIYKPNTGSVTIDGCDTYELFNDFNANLGISVVFQNHCHYEGITLQENISLSDIAINKQTFTSTQGIFDEFANKYEQIIGDSFGGIEFSGGEWQKISLLRALSKNNEILIFDEPTSSLDPISERNIFQWIMKETHGKTLILISHRLGSIKNADEIVVMERGQIIEQGSHEELMQRKGKYRTMFDAQAQWYKNTTR